VGKEVGQALGIRAIVLGAAGTQGLAIGRELLWIEREEHEQFVLNQGPNQGPPRLFEANRDRTASAPLPQLGSPGRDRGGLLCKGAVMRTSAPGRQETKVMFLIGPIDADEGGELLAGRHPVTPC